MEILIRNGLSHWTPFLTTTDCLQCPLVRESSLVRTWISCLRRMTWVVPLQPPSHVWEWSSSGSNFKDLLLKIFFIKVILLMLCAHWPAPRPIQSLIINGLYRIVWRCSYCTETDINTDSHWFQCQFIGICVCLDLCLEFGQCEHTINPKLHQLWNIRLVVVAMKILMSRL